MSRVKRDMFFNALNLMTFLCLVTYAETIENHQEDLNAVTKMDTKTRFFSLVIGMFMIIFIITLALLYFCCEYYKINERNRGIILIIYTSIFMAMFLVWEFTEIENRNLDKLIDDKTKETINMFIVGYIMWFILSIGLISFIGLLISAFVMLYKLIKKTKAKTTTSDAKLKGDKTDYGALKDHDRDIV